MADVPTDIEVGASENKTEVGIGFWPGSDDPPPMQAVSVNAAMETNSGAWALDSNRSLRMQISSEGYRTFDSLPGDGMTFWSLRLLEPDTH